MNNSEFFEMMKKVENSLRGPNVFEYGTKSDKIITVLLWLGFIALWIWLFCEYVIHNNYKLELLSLFIFLVYASLFICFSGSFQRKQSNVYSKSQTLEENELNLFVEDLERKGIGTKLFPVIVKYFTNKLPNESLYQYNGVGIYLSVIVIPVLIGFLSQNKDYFGIVISYLIVGAFFVPCFIFLFNFFRDLKINRYKKIVYLLNLQMMIENN